MKIDGLPLFLLLSGYFAGKKKGVLESIKKDFNTLIVPFLFFDFILIPFMWIIEAMINQHPLYPISWSILKKLLMDDAYQCGPIWFLGALFIVKRLYNSLLVLYQWKISSSNEVLIALMQLFVIVVLYVINQNFSILSVDSAFALFPYYILGNALRVILNKQHAIITKISIGIFACTSYGIIAFHNGLVSYDRMELGSYLLATYLEGCIGCVGFVCIFSLLNNDIGFVSAEQI